MADQSYGLRFDIFERIHLADEEIGIEELEEIELVPRIQVIPGEDYAMLRGQLLLTGLYRGEGETRELTHPIPVEITVPLNRIHRVEDIAVEIENFDVDLLNSRSLNVTGVLSLQGIETTSFTQATSAWSNREYTAAYPPAWNSESEDSSPGYSSEEQVDLSAVLNGMPEFVAAPAENLVIDKASGDSSAVWPPSNEPGDQIDEQPRNLGQDIEEEKVEQVSVDFIPPWSKVEEELSESLAPEKKQEQEESSVWFENDSEPELEDSSQIWRTDAQVEQKQEISNEETAEVTTTSTAEAQPSIPVASIESTEESTFVESSSAEALPETPTIDVLAVEEPQEMKIALGSKKDSSPIRVDQVGISQLLQTGKSPSLGADTSQEVSTSTAEQKGLAAGDSEDAVWKQSFISNIAEQTPFRKVRLVIVQREETIEEIAERYRVSARELLLHNRLSENDLAVGQVLYIP